MTDICVFAGRFRPFHEGHHYVVQTALKQAQYLFIFVGSANEPINYRNPFTFEEVREMIRSSLHPRDADRVFIFGVEDRDSDLNWVAEVQRATAEQITRLSFPQEPEIALIGFAKDDSSYYLELFPQWKCIDSGTIGEEISATTIRNALYEEEQPSVGLQHLHDNHVIPSGTFYFLRQWVYSVEFERLRREYSFMERVYLPQFSQQPYPRAFNTADACVIMGGLVLLVRRGEMPGEGLWALPGGHMKMTERGEAAALRELCEETRILDLNPELNLNILRLAVRGMKLLDDPWRSTRFRTISVAFGLRLIGTSVPKVQGADDAHEARWWNINEVTRPMMFEDHYLVIEHFANQFRD